MAPGGAFSFELMMEFQRADTLRSRTFTGLILAQFLAAFNDQAIHASAMFYAIRKDALTEAKAISLMPILFYAPWAIFCTIAGYLSDRYGKRSSLVFWKFAEIAITLIALVGFWLGTIHHSEWGPWLVLSTVFLMGTHSAFFVPAKYGIMPEILKPEQLSKGNGLLESTSFLAVILGTVSGGVLSFIYRGHEQVIGILLVALALLGAGCSLLIRPVPAANPSRPFPRNLAKPLVDNMRTLLRSKPLALAVLGIAFFTFMVAFMRATMYMHGESQNPRWDEFQISLVVATVALGISVGSPLAGFLSGGKVELGLVPLGAVGMIIATLMAAWTIFWVQGLIVSIVLIGFFSGFYTLPLFTLLQHRAPKTSKGDLIATSNFINVTGAMAASVLFFLLVLAAKQLGVARPVPQQDIVSGVLANLQMHRGHPVYFEVRESEDGPILFKAGHPLPVKKANGLNDGPVRRRRELIKVDESLTAGKPVTVSKYTLREVPHYEVRPFKTLLQDAYDQEMVPRFLFCGASLMTLVILLVLCRQLPDFFVRALLWLRSHGRYRLKVIGLNNLPSDGPAILATNCDRFQSCMQVLAATDRYTRFVLFESAADEEPRPLLRYLARRTGLVVLHPGNISQAQWEKALTSATRTLDGGNLLGITIDSEEAASEAARFLDDLRRERSASILPIYCDTAKPPRSQFNPGETSEHFGVHRVRVVIGHLLRPEAPAEDLRHNIRGLGEWLRSLDRDGSGPVTGKIPAAAT
jgi:MFS family permease